MHTNSLEKIATRSEPPYARGFRRLSRILFFGAICFGVMSWGTLDLKQEPASGPWYFANAIPFAIGILTLLLAWEGYRIGRLSRGIRTTCYRWQKTNDSIC